ncbi:MAG: fibronectin type III domain-containing protein [Acutalibacteraceae bacterium]
MKKTVKHLVAVLFCLSMVFATCVSAFALGKVATPKATATYNSITLSWSGVSNADGYEVYVASGSSWKKLATTSSKTYTHTNLKLNTTYKYRVRAYDKGIFKTTYGDYSATVSAKTALEAVSGGKVSSATATGFKLSWNKVAGATGYQIYLYSGGKWVYKLKTTTNSKTITGAKLGVTYQYRVRAYRTVSNTNYYGPFSSTIKAKCVLPAPSSFKLSSVSADSATITWSAVSSASGYQVYIKTGSSGWVKKTSATSAKYTFTKLSAGTKYTVRLRTFKKVGNTNVFSSYADFSFTTAPGKVTGLTATPYGTSATLSWNKATGATAYYVYKYNASAKKWERYKDPVKTTTFTATDLSPETSYCFTVKPYHTANGSNAYGANADSIKFKTYFADFTEFTASEYQSGFHSTHSGTYSFKWTSVKDAFYEFEYYDYVEKAWKPVYTSRYYSNQPYKSVISVGNYNLKAQASGNATAITFDTQARATKYTVQVKSYSDSWDNQTTTTTGSVKTYLAPGTKYTIRILSNGGFFRVRACQELDGKIKYTNYLSLKSVPYCSEEFTYTTPTVDFDSSNNEIKTLYTLKVVQAMNNAKNDTGKFTLKSDVKMNANIDKIESDGKDVKDFIKILAPDLYQELQNSFNETNSTTLNFENGRATYTKNGNTYNIFPDEAIAPSRSSAYLYKQDDVANFSKKISAVSVVNASNGAQTITLTLKKETSKNGSATPVHAGFTENMAKEFAGVDDAGNIDLSVGDTTVKAVITKEGKLTSLAVTSPFTVSMSGSADGMNFLMALSGTSSYNYSITR